MITQNVRDFLFHWDNYSWDYLKKYYAMPDVKEFLEAHVSGSQKLYRGIHYEKDSIQDLLQSTGGDLKVHSEWTFKLERPTSWTNNKKYAQDFVWGGENGEYGFVFEMVTDRILFDFNLLTPEEMKELKGKDYSVRDNENEIIVKAGTYKMKLAYLCEATGSIGCDGQEFESVDRWGLPL